MARRKRNYSLKWLFFSFSGRIRASTFFLSAVLIVSMHAYIVIQITRTPETSWQFGAWGLVYLIVLLVSAWAGFALAFKRLHDMGYSGLLAVIMFIPMLSLLFFFALCFWPGNHGRNKFGESPLVHR